MLALIYLSDDRPYTTGTLSMPVLHTDWWALLLILYLLLVFVTESMKRVRDTDNKQCGSPGGLGLGLD